MINNSSINPIIPGFAPDPSLVLVDGTYFLVNSTFHLFPGLPIYTSQDLVHWKQIGNAINRLEQLSLGKSSTLIHREVDSHLVATGGLYAPTIRYHNGTFYIVCTNVVNHSNDGSKSELQNFIISTTNIHGNEWSNAVYFDFYGIDPSLFFDADGKVYLCGSKSPGPQTKIMLFEIDVETREKLSEEKELWHGTGGIYPEGPHIYSYNSYYYLMVAEGGTHEGHSVTMARSKSIWGPYEPSPKNPILSAAETDEYVQCTGHCEAFEGSNGEWWGVCLGIRMGATGLYGLGRETFLTRGKWSDDGWLEFDRAKMHVEGFEDVKTHERLTAVPGADLLYIHDPDFSRYKITDRGMVLTATAHDLTSAEASPSFVGKRQRQLQGCSSVTFLNLSQNSTESSLMAGLAIYKDEHRFFRIFYSSPSHNVKVQIVNTAKGIDRTIEQELNGRFERLRLVIQYTEMEYKVSYAMDDNNIKDLTNVEAMELSDKDFVGPIIGVYAVNENTSEGTTQVTFEDLVVDNA